MQQMMKPPLISAAAQPIFSYKRGREKALGHAVADDPAMVLELVETAGSPVDHHASTADLSHERAGYTEADPVIDW
ncbi:hypothetical protein [Thermogemmatispora tikiterensis]|uniref:Uncharacterized protein n=1 Tax=Thermogemmatispora tikiterensis TaxID=1825093 RepID=A0A328VD89_9CHLR|nr:hypothetical protein [Thermogemmatispora tikiterensis]RAQ93912.1 hypothetical protein A4R35_00105 [Thermogemmatispora tikiterensis]